jgi:hypothetical protein
LFSARFGGAGVGLAFCPKEFNVNVNKTADNRNIYLIRISSPVWNVCLLIAAPNFMTQSVYRPAILPFATEAIIKNR